MEDEVRGVLERHPQIAFGLVFGSVGRGEARADSDLDVALGLMDGEHLTALDLGGLVSEIEQVTGRDTDVVVLEGKQLGLDYRAFRDGRILFMRDRAAFLRRKVRAILDYLDFKPIEDRCVAGVLRAAARGRSGVVAFKVAAIRDAVARIREALPADAGAFAVDRTAREVVALNLLVAIQEALDLATHWLADAGWEVPSSHRGVFEALARPDGALDEALASRLAAAAGLRNLIAHRYAVLDWRRLHAVAATGLGDLEELCALAARRVSGPT